MSYPAFLEEPHVVLRVVHSSAARASPQRCACACTLKPLVKAWGFSSMGVSRKGSEARYRIQRLHVELLRQGDKTDRWLASGAAFRLLVNTGSFMEMRAARAAWIA